MMKFGVGTSCFKALLVSLMVLGMLTACVTAPSPTVAPNRAQIINTYITIAQAGFADSLQTAQQLEQAIDKLLATPSAATLKAAQDAWRAARVPYLQTEAFRFGNAVVDEWESKVNSWPLDEGLIDYVAPAYGLESDNNYFYTANIIGNSLLDIGGISVDAAIISPQLLAETLHEIDGVPTNVATGYHAIEFLLWGQDLNGTNPGAGARAYTDYSLQQCTNGSCQRRRDYLKSATTLLVADLDEMVQNWAEYGAATVALHSKGEAGGLATILTGLGSLAYGELAGERIRLGFLLHDPEEEQDCFSDNTHWSHYYDAKGISNVYRGEYTRVNGTVIQGASLQQLIKSEAPALHAEISARLEATQLAMTTLVELGETGTTYDVLIGSNNAQGEELINRIVAALMEETRTIEKIINQLQLQNVSIEGSDSLPTPR